MFSRNRLMRCFSAASALMLALVLATPAQAAEVVLKKGTDVHLVFDSSLDSKTAKEGDTVKFHVEKPVEVDGKTVIAEGAKVTGTVTKVTGRGRYGVNAKVQLKMSPVPSTTGKVIPLGFKTKGQAVSNKTGEAAGATAAGAVVLGPVGLVAGYFIPGKQVKAKPGDKFTVNVDQDVTLKIK